MKTRPGQFSITLWKWVSGWWCLNLESMAVLAVTKIKAPSECRFGCCNYQAATIHISHKVGLMPEWVRDYVILHEMVHLIEPNHSRAFWDIISRYKLAERARGYLIAVGID